MIQWYNLGSFETLVPDEVDRAFCGVVLVTCLLDLGHCLVIKMAKEVTCSWVHAVI